MVVGRSPNRPPLGLQPALAWTAILALFGVTILGAFAGAGGLLRLFFPLGTFGVATLLYFRYPRLYLGFTWWTWILSPWIRRLIDYRSGWDEQGIVLLAPYFATLLTVLTFGRYFPTMLYRGGLPFILSALAVLYAYCIGLLTNPWMGATVSLLEWLMPVMLAFHLFVHWGQYPQMRQNFERVFFWGVLVTGAYGVVQYLVAPEWDRFWLINSNAVAFGTPEPLGIRVFSTLNSPQPFGVFMMAGLILLLNHRSVGLMPAAGVGYLSFLLSAARSAWLGWLVAIVSFVPSLRPRLQMRLVVAIAVMSLCVVPLATMPPFADIIGQRLDSLSNTQDDVSYNARVEGYSALMGRALTQGLGNGLGFVLESNSLGSNDSGILAMLFSLGWLGTLPYLGGLGMLMFRLFQLSAKTLDPFGSAARAIALAIFAQIGLNHVLAGIFGVLLWGFVGMGMAGRQYLLHQAAIARQGLEPFPAVDSVVLSQHQR